MKLDLFDPNRTWAVGDGDCRINGTQLKALLDAVPDEKEMLRAVGAINRADRRFDVAITVLKHQNFVWYDNSRGVWKLVRTT
jgi:hypothetical protein